MTAQHRPVITLFAQPTSSERLRREGWFLPRAMSHLVLAAEQHFRVICIHIDCAKCRTHILTSYTLACRLLIAFRC
jgi:hypothetical protein